MGQPEGKHELRSGHEQLRCQSLEEGSEALVLHHVGHDPESTLGVLKVPVLNTGLDDIERSYAKSLLLSITNHATKSMTRLTLIPAQRLHLRRRLGSACPIRYPSTNFSMRSIV